MTASETFIILMGIVTAFGVLARWLKLPYPILLVIGGLVLSLQPWVPEDVIRRYQLPPDLALLFFLPPLLYAAAFNTHWPEFRRQLRSISLLAVGLVLFTAAAVAVACHYLFDLPWAVGFLLGAIVSPPDAVAATAITSRMKVPRLVVTILEGESLVNDSTALVSYRMAVAAVASGVFVWWESGVQFVFVSVGGIAIGLVGAVAVVALHRFLNRRKLVDAKLNIVITLITPYAVYLPAEHLHVSGVLAVVSAGLWVGHRCEQVFERELFIEAKAVWEMVEFLMNGVIFILIGFQLPLILDGVASSGEAMTLDRLLVTAAVVTAVVIVTRIVWVFPGAYLPRWVDRAVFKMDVVFPPWQGVAVVSWAGMRGVVSLAVALALPLTTADGSPFPHRNLLLFLTFAVIFGTLVGQGLTLPWLIRGLKVDRMAEAESVVDDH